MLFLHQAHGLVAELGAVIDGSDAGLDGVERARLALRVHADDGAEALRFFDRGGQLRLGVLVGRVQHAIHHGVWAGLVHLDEVRTLLVLLADDFDNLVAGVGVVGVGEHVLRGVEVVGVFMAAENVDGVGADAHARTGNDAGVDGIADRRAGGAGAFGAHVALRGEAGHEVGFGGLLGEDGAPWDGLLDGLQVLRAGMQEQMHVRVDETGEQRGVAEVDDVRALRMIDGCAHGLDALALDENLAGLKDVAGVHLEKTRGVEHDGGVGRGLRHAERREEHRAHEQG